VSVTRTTSSHIKYEDVVNMWSRLYARSRKDAVWFINQDIEPDLYAMSLTIGTAGVPVYMPAGGLSGNQYATLYGRPVIATEYNASLGTVGDIVLADLGQYAMIRKGGLQSDSSIHVRFIYNESTFRWIYRTDGQPKWTTPVTPAKGSNTKSPFIVLAT
jgi:HK97 family phage major capsid protein